MKRIRLVTTLVAVSLACACAALPRAAGSTPSTSTTPAASASSGIPSPVPPTPAGSPTSSTTPQAPASSPTLSCSSAPTAAAEPLVMLPLAANLRGNPIQIVSFAVPANPSPFCTLNGGMYDVRFISPTEIGYVVNSSQDNPIGGTSTIQRMSLTDGRPVTVASMQGDVLDAAWSPDGSNVAFILYTYPDANQLWLKTGDAAPRALTPLIPLGGRDVSVDDETIVRFSPDGKYLLMVDTFVSGAAPASADLAMFQVRSIPDGKLVWVPPAALVQSGGKFGPFISWAVWSHLTDRLYYRDQSGVHMWDAASSTVGDVVRGLLWISPSLSANDQLVAYQQTVNGQPQIDIRDLKSGTVRTLPGSLGFPTLISSTALIEFHLTGNTQMGPPFLTDRGYVLNLTTGSETALKQMGTPIDMWPR